MGINWKWNDTYTTTTTADDITRGIGLTGTTTYTTGDPIEIKAPEWKIGDKIELNSPITVEPINYGWVCPRCGRANAPWVSQCSCNSSPFVKTSASSAYSASPCKDCSNNPANGGSGICLCTLGTPKITC